MELFNKKAVLFDLDGTVIDSQDGIFNALEYMFNKLGFRCGDRSEYHCFIGPSIGATLRIKYGFTEEAAENAVSVYREYYGTRGYLECAAYDGIEKILRELKSSGKLVALATKKPEIFSVKIIEELKLGKYFDAVCGSELTDHHDSKAHILENAAAALKLPYEECVMVGDTKYDAIAAREIGMDCIGVLYGFGDREQLVANGAEYIAEDTEELFRMLTQAI